MRLSITTLSLLCVIARTSLAACPYADKLARSELPSEHPAIERRAAAAGKKGVFYMNRIGPSSSTLYVANADGSNERALLATNESVFEYHGHFSPDGKYVTFTSERVDGNADLYRVNVDGSNLVNIRPPFPFPFHGAVGKQLLIDSNRLRS